jgi:hypothetical protein
LKWCPLTKIRNFFFLFCLVHVSKYFLILLLIIIAIRNVCRIIIWKDLNWKMCKKNPYNCVHGFRPENNRFLIDCNVQSNTAIIVKHWHKWIDIHNTKWNLYIHTLYHAYGTQHHTFTQITSIIIPQGHNYIAFLKKIYSKVAVHLYVFTFVEIIFNLKNGVLLI